MPADTKPDDPGTERDAISTPAKDIIKISLPNICGDPILKISFALASDSLDLSWDKLRIYNIRHADIVETDDSLLTIRCNGTSELYLHSNFDLLQNIYYYPFISSVLLIDFGFQSTHTAMLEVDVSNEFKSLSFFSYVKNRHSNKRHFKMNETWSDDRGVFYFALSKENRLHFT